jgi:hypothetical protein
MVPAHVHTIPGELLQLLSRYPQIPSEGDCNTAEVVLPLAVE